MHMVQHAPSSRYCAVKRYTMCTTMRTHPLALMSCAGCAVLCQVDGRVSSKTIQRLQGQVEAREQELGALNIKVCAPSWLHCSRGLPQACWVRSTVTTEQTATSLQTLASASLGSSLYKCPFQSFPVIWSWRQLVLPQCDLLLWLAFLCIAAAATGCLVP
jgi:hypothetical protein